MGSEGVSLCFFSTNLDLETEKLLSQTDFQFSCLALLQVSWIAGFFVFIDALFNFVWDQGPFLLFPFASSAHVSVALPQMETWVEGRRPTISPCSAPGNTVVPIGHFHSFSVFPRCVLMLTLRE